MSHWRTFGSPSRCCWMDPSGAVASGDGRILWEGGWKGNCHDRGVFGHSGIEEDPHGTFFCLETPHRAVAPSLDPTGAPSPSPRPGTDGSTQRTWSSPSCFQAAGMPSHRSHSRVSGRAEPLGTYLVAVTTIPSAPKLSTHTTATSASHPDGKPGQAPIPAPALWKTIQTGAILRDLLRGLPPLLPPRHSFAKPRSPNSQAAPVGSPEHSPIQTSHLFQGMERIWTHPLILSNNAAPAANSSQDRTLLTCQSQEMLNSRTWSSSQIPSSRAPNYPPCWAIKIIRAAAYQS